MMYRTCIIPIAYTIFFCALNAMELSPCESLPNEIIHKIYDFLIEVPIASNKEKYITNTSEQNANSLLLTLLHIDLTPLKPLLYVSNTLRDQTIRFINLDQKQIPLLAKKCVLLKSPACVKHLAHQYKKAFGSFFISNRLTDVSQNYTTHYTTTRKRLLAYLDEKNFYRGSHIRNGDRDEYILDKTMQDLMNKEILNNVEHVVDTLNTFVKDTDVRDACLDNLPISLLMCVLTPNNLLCEHYYDNGVIGCHTLLRSAIESNQLSLAKWLLLWGADPNLKHHVHPDTLLNKTISTKNLTAVELLLDHNANPNNARLFHSPLSSLSFAIREDNCEDNIDCVKLLLKYRADPNICEFDYFTPTFEAIRQNKISILKLLLDAGGNPLTTNQSIIILLNNVDTEITTLLRERGFCTNHIKEKKPKTYGLTYRL